MTAFENFAGNASVAQTLARTIESGNIPQTILLGGPEGLGKATLARRFGARLLGGALQIEQDDLNLPANIETVELREKWTAEKRADDPLLFSSHPDFVTFAPEGPLRQISIQQVRLLNERARFKPLRGRWRVFLIDHLDRANEQAANSLLKLLEEPPDHLIVLATAENLYDLLPTLRSRSVIFQMTRLDDSEMRRFAEARSLDDVETRVALAEGCPGIAVSLNVTAFRERRNLMLSLLECASGIVPFATWMQRSESFANRKAEKLDLYLKPAYSLLEDVLLTWQGREAVRNLDIQDRIATVSRHVSFRWIEKATASLDEIAHMLRRNIQKMIALDAVIMDLRNQLESRGT